MEQNDWIIGELDRLFAEEKDFRYLALIKAAREVVQEQDKRIWQMEGELDGTLWSPQNWDE